MKTFKLILSIVASLIVLFLISTAAFAEIDVTVNAAYDLSTGMIVISGTVDDLDISSLRIIVYRPGYTKEMIADGTATIEEAIANFDETFVLFGSFEYKYKPLSTDPTGYYTVYINVADDQIEESSFFYGTDDVVADFKAAANEDAYYMIDRYIMYEAYLKPSYDVFSRLEVSDQRDIIVETMSDTDYETLSEFSTNLNNNSVKRLFKTTSKSADIKYLIEKYSAVLGIDLTNPTYTKYISPTSSYVEDLYYMMATSQNYKATDTPDAAFKKAVAMTALNKIVSKGQIATIAKDNSVALNISMSAYEKLSDKQKDNALNTLYDGKAYLLAKCEDFKQRWDSAVSSAQSGDSNPPSSGPGPGGPGPGHNPINQNPGNTPSTGVVVEKPVETETVLFNDLGSVEWAKDAIVTLAKAGIINGKADMTFAPNDNVTREEFLKMLFLCATLKVDENAETTFKDVDKSEWYYGYIATAQQMGLVSGISEDTFGTGQSITREDIAVMIIRAVSKLGVDLIMPYQKTVFTDNANISGYAVESIYAMQKAGIINGYDDGSFLPQAFATRAESAQIIYKLTNLFLH